MRKKWLLEFSPKPKEETPPNLVKGTIRVSKSEI